MSRKWNLRSRNFLAKHFSFLWYVVLVFLYCTKQEGERCSADITLGYDLSNCPFSLAEPTFQSGSLKRPGSSRQLPSNLRILQNPLSSGFNPEGIYVWQYIPLLERTQQGTLDKIHFCFFSANGEWKKNFFFVKPMYIFLLPPTHPLEPYPVHWC